MIRKTIEISTPGSRLSVANRQLVIERPEMPKATLPLEDLGVVIVDDRRAIYTQSALIELMAASATLIVTGPDHLPAGMMLPLDAHHIQTERHRAQIETGEPTRKRIWQALVMAKIRQQATILSHFTGETGGLDAMSRRVRSGDPDNLEAQAAQRYWPRLFGKDFRRDRDAKGINALLYYGYAVIRSAVARSIVAAGLIPSLGVFHKNRSNAFCLADDLFEPYRPFVDWRVKMLHQAAEGEELKIADKPVRAALLALFNEGIIVNERRLPMLGAIEASASSLARALTGGEKALALPEGLPLGQSGTEEDDGT
ncbi:type II CRISPR-associated endonuclease Cas1 [Rhabdaerophilum sp.]|uniref:type II CRISPR-associated endonuclease Cas1 n=1 Tax=Rhabdaerophilum sp. TaxID=2717341 RepID=UPI0038D40025